MGLKRKIMDYEPAKVFEVAFWDPGENGIQQTGTWASCPKFIDARYPFTTLLHQGLIERVFIEDMEKYGTHVQRPWKITGFKNDAKDPTYPVEVKMAHVDGTVTETVRAKYLFSGEGARSFVRNQLGVKMTYKDPISYVWGVMDGVVRTNFPDIKMKCTIHSDSGSIMVIPRENNMVRLYIQLASSTDTNWDPKSCKIATAEEVQRKAQAILKPYTISWDRVEWYSVYPIGQGIAERYTLDERVFMGGDACHTHSPKAGQGMNTAFLDAVNLAWKIHHVESGWAQRSLPSTYESERKLIAETLLDFDARYAKLFSARIPSAGEVAGASSNETEDNDFIKTFKESCEFTSGYGVAYRPNAINWGPEHPAQHPLILQYEKGTQQRTGRILIPSTVTRVVDANVVPLEQQIPLNGSYRMFIFGGQPSKTATAIKDLATHMAAPTSFFSTFLFKDLSTNDRYHERHNPHTSFLSLALIFNSPRSKIHIDQQLPAIFARYADHVYADDVWDRKVPDATAAAHAKMGLDQETGGIVVVRPDGYVGIVVKLEEGQGTCEALNKYFEVVMGRKLGSEKASL